MIEHIQQTIQLTFSYSNIFTENVFDPDNRILLETVVAGRAPGKRAAKVLAVVDREVASQHPGLIKGICAYCERHQDVFSLVAAPVLVPGGEEVKNDDRYVREIQERVNRHGIDRHSYIFAIGGGAVLDMVGFAASVSHRGIRLVRFPTTVLAQNDSGVGVKTGINAFGKKNFLGTFVPPFAVLNDLTFLTTLSDRDWRSGIAEAVKVALIKDAHFFAFIEKHAAQLVARDMGSMQELIIRCARLHLDHIATCGDPFESGTSRPLDFGHWAAHKLEQLSAFRVRHGEAVAIGLALDSTYSMLTGTLDKGAWERILRLLQALGFNLFEPELLEGAGTDGTPAILKGLEEFREHLGGELTVMLLHGLGGGFETHHMDEKTILRGMEILQYWQTCPESAILASAST